MAGKLNPNLAKIHRSYTVEEASVLFGVHKNTVRNWVENGLEVCDDQRPVLLLGNALRGFLQSKKQNRKQKCKPCEMYCLRCKLPRMTAENMADYVPITATTGRLIGICSTCESLVNKYISLEKLALIEGQMDVTFPKAEKRIGDRDIPLLNSDFK